MNPKERDIWLASFREQSDLKELTRLMDKYGIRTPSKLKGDQDERSESATVQAEAESKE